MGTVILDPWEHSEVYTYIELDGVRSPGPCALTADARLSLKIEDQQSPGFTGAFPVLRGEELPTLPYKLRLWTAEHFSNAGPFVDLLLEGYKKRLNRVFTLNDQALAHTGFVKATFKDLSQLKQLQEGQIPHAIEFTLKAYRKRTPLQSAPRGPKTELEKLEEKLNEEAAKLNRQVDAASQAKAKGK